MKLLSNGQPSSILFLLPFLPALALLIHPYAFTSRCRDCPDLTPCEAYGGAKAVFVGRAISGEEIKWDDRNGGKKGIQLVGKVRFIVEQSFKGVYGNEIEVIAWDRECGYGPFEKGERYLLYLNRYDNEGLSADICSRSTHISDADEDLKFLSSLTSKTCGARLYGTVGNVDIDLYKRDKEGLRSVGRIYIGVPGITITARDYYVVASSAPRRPALWKYFYAEPPLVELKGENITGLRLTLSWNEETFKDFFKKK